MEYLLGILKGIVIGLANIIPGVSGGTMMVSMGIYDTLIHCINNLFKQFKKSVLTLLPYGIGMVLAIAIGAIGLKAAFRDYPLPTNTLFIGLILGSLPMILKEMKGEKKGIPGAVIFLILFAVVVVLKIVEGENTANIQLSVFEVLKLFVLGCVASATMVIPGVSGSMILKTLGYYEPIVTGAIPAVLDGVKNGNWAAIGLNIGILLPFALGIVVGIFAIAKLIEVLLKKWKGYTYCAILGMVLASPVAILMENGLFENIGAGKIIVSIITFGVGLLISTLLGGDELRNPFVRKSSK